MNKLIKYLVFVAVVIVAASFPLMVVWGMVAAWYGVATISFVQALGVVGAMTGLSVAVGLPVGIAQKLLGIEAGEIEEN